MTLEELTTELGLPFTSINADEQLQALTVPGSDEKN